MEWITEKKKRKTQKHNHSNKILSTPHNQSIEIQNAELNE